MSTLQRILEPPVAQKKIHRYEHHGITLEDPYAWMRDRNYPEVTDPEILTYLNEENAYFEANMAPLASLTQQLFEEIKGRQPAEDSCEPYDKDGYCYQWRYAKEAQYCTWYRAPITDRDAWEVLLDETQLAQGYEYFSLGSLSVSPCGSKLAYSTDTEGDERYTLHVIDLATRRPLTAAIENTLGTAIWSADSDALAYVVVNDQWQPLKVLHRSLAQSSPRDELLFEESDTGFRVDVDLSQSGQFVFIETGSHTTSEVWILPRDNLLATPELMRPRQEDVEYHVDHGNGEFIIRSNVQHQNFALYRTPEAHPRHDSWQLFMHGDSRHYLTSHSVLRDRLIVEVRIDGMTQIRAVEQDGSSHYIKFGETAYEVSIGNNPEFDTQTLRLNYTSMVTPHSVFDYDLTASELTLRRQREIPSGYDPTEFVTERLSARVRDGVDVPISVVYHKSTPTDGSAPLYLYGYGAYGLGMTASFSAARISLLERGFIFAIAHIRGGDELGYDWYTAGKLDRRTNTFNDFVDCALSLIAKNYTQSGRIAIAGGSAGGELMGAVVNQAPALWGAVAAHVPFVDVLNTMLDATLPLTPPEWPEWGNPIEDAYAFQTIRAYSPYDQLKPGYFPPMLVTAGLNDPRVTYWEPAKYVAKLRTCKLDTQPLLLKTNMGAGHGGQSGRFDAIKEIAEEYAFFLNVLGLEGAGSG